MGIFGDCDLSNIPRGEPHGTAPDAIAFSFVGTVEKRVEFCPSEFEGLTTADIAGEIRGVLRSIDPGAQFYEADVEIAAVTLRNAVDAQV